MRWAALAAWLLTAGGGAVLFAQWWRHGGRRQREGIRTPRLLAHAGTALLGLVLWIAFLVADATAAAWAAFALLLVVGLLGVWMLAVSFRGTTRTLRTETPAEGMFPLPLVIGHGLLATTTLLLTGLAAAGL